MQCYISIITGKNKFVGADSKAVITQEILITSEPRNQANNWSFIIYDTDIVLLGSMGELGTKGEAVEP